MNVVVQKPARGRVSRERPFDLFHPLDDRSPLDTEPWCGGRGQRAKRVVIRMLRPIEPPVGIGASGDRGMEFRQLTANRPPCIRHRVRIGTILAKRLAVNAFPDRVRTRGNLARVVKGDQVRHWQAGGTRHRRGHGFGAGVGNGFRMIGGDPQHHVASGVNAVRHARARQRLPRIADAMALQDGVNGIGDHLYNSSFITLNLTVNRQLSTVNCLA